MRLVTRVLFVVLVGCQNPGEPIPPPIAGYYRLTAINGHALPYAPDPTVQSTVVAGGLTIAADNGWTAGDTTHGITVSIFRWGGIVERDAEVATSFTFRDSTLAGTRYTGTLEGQTFTLTGSGRVYRYDRQP